MCENKDNTVSLSDIIIAGICTLQEKNGVSACEIAEYVAKKRCCKLTQIEGMIKMILCKAITNGILCEKKGQYHISAKYDDLPKVSSDPVCLQEESENSDDEGDDDDDPCAEKCNPCATLTFSKNDLEDDDDDNCRNILSKEMRNKEKKLPSSTSVSELILSAVYFLQKKNGVTAKDITKYICHKRGFKQSQMRNKVKEALQRGTKNGIFNLKRGLYKVDNSCKRKFTNLKKKVKKKTEFEKMSKKFTEKKVPVEKCALEEKKLTPIKENSERCTLLKNRVGSHTSSEDVFERRGRENSYFEPSLLARPSDEEYDDFDEEDDDNEDDDEYSDLDDVDNPDIYTFTFTDDPSHEQFPEFKIFSAARQGRQKRASTRKQGRKKSKNRGRGKKRKISRPRKKKRPNEEKNKTKEIESDDDDYFDEDDSDYSGESEAGEPRGQIKFDFRPPKIKKVEKQTNSMEEVKKNKESVGDKENKEGKENKETKANDKKKGKQTTVTANKKCKKSKCESSEENMMATNQKNLDKEGRSLSKSECMLTSSTKLLPSDFKLSISPNMIVSDVKFSPTTIKFETQDSSAMLLADITQNESVDQEKLFSDFKTFCECQPPKRKNPTNRGDEASTKDAQPTEKRTKSKC